MKSNSDICCLKIVDNFHLKTISAVLSFELRPETGKSPKSRAAWKTDRNSPLDDPETWRSLTREVADSTSIFFPDLWVRIPNLEFKFENVGILGNVQFYTNKERDDNFRTNSESGVKVSKCLWFWYYLILTNI
jgi:hypothetical protein